MIHSRLTGYDVDKIFCWEVDSESDRLLLDFSDRPTWMTLDDLLNRLCLQNDDGSAWRLESHTPIVWASIGGGGAAVTFSSEFLISDWLSGPGIYYIDFTHNLNTLYTSIDIREGNSVVRADTITLDLNRIRVQVTADPDLRFDGNITIK